LSGNLYITRPDATERAPETPEVPFRKDGEFLPHAPTRALPWAWAALVAPPRSRRGHRAPPRGVDVKPTPAGTWRGRKRPEIPDFGQKRPKTTKNGVLWVFTHISRFSGKRYQDFSQKLAENGQKPLFWGFEDPGPKRGLFPVPGSRARGVLHQPLAPGPCARGDPGGVERPAPRDAAGDSPGPRRGASGPGPGPRSRGTGTGPRREGLM